MDSPNASPRTGWREATRDALAANGGAERTGGRTKQFTRGTKRVGRTAAHRSEIDALVFDRRGRARPTPGAPEVNPEDSAGQAYRRVAWPDEQARPTSSHARRGRI